jgi:hypothetical protein
VRVGDQAELAQLSDGIDHGLGVPAHDRAGMLAERRAIAEVVDPGREAPGNARVGHENPHADRLRV